MQMKVDLYIETHEYIRLMNYYDLDVYVDLKWSKNCLYVIVKYSRSDKSPLTAELVFWFRSNRSMAL